MTGQIIAYFESIVLNAYYSRLIKISQFDFAEFPYKNLTLLFFPALSHDLHLQVLETARNWL